MSLINRRDAIEVISSMRVWLGGKDIFDINAKRSVIDAIDIQPSVDAIEVIRCADCAYYGKSPFGHPRIGWCRIDCKHRKPEFYCASADRK